MFPQPVLNEGSLPLLAGLTPLPVVSLLRATRIYVGTLRNRR